VEVIRLFFLRKRQSWEKIDLDLFPPVARALRRAIMASPEDPER
jgi:hypothetical protein